MFSEEMLFIKFQSFSPQLLIPLLFNYKKKNFTVMPTSHRINQIIKVIIINKTK